MSVSLKELTDKLVADNASYKGGALTVIACNATSDIGHSIIDSAEAMEVDVPQNCKLVNMDTDFRQDGEAVTEMPALLGSWLEATLRTYDAEHNLVLYVFHALDGEGKFKGQLIKLAESNGKIGGLPECTLDLLTSAYHPMNTLDFSQELFDFMLRQEAVQVTCDRGTNLKITMRHKQNYPDDTELECYKLVNSNGVLQHGTFANPYPAEVFAHPLSVDGTLVITGSYGYLLETEQYRGKHAALMKQLDKTPIIWKISGGFITDVLCDDEFIQGFVRRKVFEEDTKWGNRIGEFGLPANLYVLQRALTGNMAIDEKGRVHLANGHGYPKRTGARYISDTHSDGLIACATLRSLTSGIVFMERNVYSPAIFRTLS